MAYITGQTEQGCCLPVKYLGNGTYECEPDVGETHKKHRIFNDYHMFYAKIVGSVGENITILMLIYSVFMAPISEELIFRGVTYRIARRAFPFWVANIIQAVLFGIFHMNPLQGCYTFVIGLFMGYICEKGGTLYHAIFFHFLFNLWGTTAGEWLVVEDETLMGLIVMIGTVVGLSAGLYFFHKGNEKKRITI